MYNYLFTVDRLFDFLFKNVLFSQPTACHLRASFIFAYVYRPMFLPLGTLASSICSLSSSSCFCSSSSCFCSSSPLAFALLLLAFALFFLLLLFVFFFFLLLFLKTRFGLPDLVFSHSWVPLPRYFFGKVGRWTARFSCSTRNGFSTVQSDGCFVRGHGEFDCCFCMEATFFRRSLYNLHLPFEFIAKLQCCW